jgi:hypothetical protein
MEKIKKRKKKKEEEEEDRAPFFSPLFSFPCFFFFSNPELGGSTVHIMEDYTRYMRLLITMVHAVGRLVDAGRELSHFAG